MCGIVGMAGNITPQWEKVFKDMLLMDAVRGMDSTGVVQVPLGTNQPVRWEKDVGLPPNLWELNDSQIFTYAGSLKGSSKMLLGHNRAATLGLVTVNNAHPFEFGNVVGVHNGTLRDYDDLINAKTHDVDSQALLENIAVKGIEETWKSFRGAAAVVWWDTEKNQLNVIRNSERPLHCAYSKNKDLLIWASETWMIEAAAARRKVDLYTEKDDKGVEKQQFYYFAEDEIYTYNVTGTNFTMERKEKLEKKPLPTTTHTWSGGTNASFKGGKKKPTTGFVVGRKRKRNKQINQGWAKNMERADTSTRGLRITLRAEMNDGMKFIAKFDQNQDVEGYLYIYPNSPEAIEQLRHALKYGNTRFKIAARLRYLENKNGYREWGVSSAGIKPIISSVIDGGKKDDEEPVVRATYRHYNELYVTEGVWREYLEHGPGRCACAWCSEPLEPIEAEEMMFLSRNEALCPQCSIDEDVIDNLGAIFPAILGDKRNVG